MSERWITPETQRRTRTPPLRRLGQALLVIVLVLPVLYGAVAALAPTPSVSASNVTIAVPSSTPVTVAWPANVQASAFVIDGLPGAEGSDGNAAPLPMASLTKVITALVVLEARPLDGGNGATITLTDADVAWMQEAFDEKAPYFPARPGQTVTQLQLLEWSLTFSAANAASVLATWAFGDMPTFLAAANDWAARHGLDSVVVVDATGLDAAGVATAADLAQLGRIAMANPDAARAMGLSSVPVPGLGAVENSNALLGTAGIDAGKTGSLFVSGRNLLISGTHEINGVAYRAVVVVLGAVTYDDVIATSRMLYDSLWQNIHEVELVPAGTVVGTFEIPWDEPVSAVTMHALTAVVWDTTQVDVTVEIRDAEPNVQSQTVGRAVVSLGDTELESEVRTDSAVPTPDIGWRLLHPLDVGGWVIDAVQRSF